MKYLLTILLLAAVAVSCRNKVSPSSPVTGMQQDTARFYPLSNFIKEQIEYVDLRGFKIYRVFKKDKKKDSAAFTKEQFLAEARVFQERAASFAKAKAAFRESVFDDLSTSSITFSYQCSNSKASEVVNVDILLDERTQAVKRSFIRSAYLRGDTTIQEQCNWKANKSFQINRTFTTPNGYTSNENIFVNWDDKP